MSDATDRILLGRKRLADAYTQQHESDAEAARAYAEDILRSDPLALTVAEAARRLSVSVSTIGAMIADKRLPCVRSPWFWRNLAGGRGAARVTAGIA